MKVLVTGGAGFIGSNVADAYLADGHEVVVLDDLTTGFEEHVPRGVAFVRGSVTDDDSVRAAMRDVEIVHHHAASRAVLRSVEDPLGTDAVNSAGTLRLLTAARDASVRRFVLASSSSVYGGVAPLPTPESAPLTPKSPYAVSKLAAEHYARVFWELFGLETVALRYFNVFGPRQRPDSMYAAVIPLFIGALRNGERPVVHGDGSQFRDFTYIDNVIAANRLAATVDPALVSGKAFNIACGGRFSILETLELIARLLDVEANPIFTESRAGDVRQSCADISAARAVLGYEPDIDFEAGMARTVAWFREHR
ncbi:MAG: UDP-glucose 4-epimerase [Actinomycetota bacterium]|nr:UDP-glucose 4-epimerase [Actinomycetota bacterium]